MCDTMLDVKTYLHTTIEFYLDGNQVPHKGFVVDEKPGKVIVRIEHGKFHGEEWEIPVDSICDDTYELYTSDEERMYAWWDSE